MLKRIAWAIALSVGLLAIATLVVYIGSERAIRAPVAQAVDTLPPGDAANGRRIAAIAGCTSCHRRDLGGLRVQYGAWGSIVAPDISRARDRYDAISLLRLLRTGVKADGRRALLMPFQASERLNDAEAADLVAYLLAAPPAKGGVTGTSWLYPTLRASILIGRTPVPSIDDPGGPDLRADRLEPERGRHLAAVGCAWCHGRYLAGGEGAEDVALPQALGYDRWQFRRLLRTGVARGDPASHRVRRDVHRDRFSQLDDAEIQALFAFAQRAN